MFFQNWAHRYDPGIPTKKEITESFHWNLWMKRIFPYQELEDGSSIVLVDSWPGGSRITWRTRAVDVMKTSYSSKEEAVRLIHGHLGVTTNDIRANWYTQKGPNEGYLLAWRYKPVHRIAVSRPADMKFMRNGWLEVSDAEVAARWGIAL